MEKKNSTVMLLLGRTPSNSQCVAYHHFPQSPALQFQPAQAAMCHFLTSYLPRVVQQGQVSLASQEPRFSLYRSLMSGIEGVRILIF